MRPGDCEAFEGGNVGGHGVARMLPADVGKAGREWIGCSGGLAGALAQPRPSAEAKSEVNERSPSQCPFVNRLSVSVRLGLRPVGSIWMLSPRDRSPAFPQETSTPHLARISLLGR